MKNKYSKLKKYDQMHVLKYIDELSSTEQAELFAQIANLDFSYLDELQKKLDAVDTSAIEPIEALTIEQIEQNKQEYERVGVKAIQNGEVGVLLLAGGMGTRLGSDNPKGMYNIGKTKEVYIFQRIFENLLDVVNKTGTYIPFFIMTSDLNDKTTREFLHAKNYFGYDPNYIKFFVQDMAPCVDFNGKILMQSKSKIATSPNGNGGWVASLLNNKEAKEMLEKSNIKWLNFFAVDNVLQRVADPVFVGATISSGCEVGAKTIKKCDPYEKVGVVCKKEGKPYVIEYIDLTDEMANATNENGERLYNYGVILNYLFNVDTLHRINNQKMPIHVVTKKIEYIDENGVLVKPTEPNGYKFETINVDMFGFAKTCLPFEVERRREFAPIKNKTGVDSVESAQKLLEENGYEL